MFLQASVILLTGGCLQTPPKQTPPGADTPLEQIFPRADSPHSRHPPGADTPQEQTPRADTPWSRHPPWEQTPPRAEPPPEQTHPQEADSSIWSTSGRYASYWNAFLFEKHVSRMLSKGGLCGRGACMNGGMSVAGCVWQGGYT